VYRALGFPPQFFTVMFAVPRIVGYLSHWKESLADPDTKIMRPQEDYRVSVCCAGPGVCRDRAHDSMDKLTDILRCPVWVGVEPLHVTVIQCPMKNQSNACASAHALRVVCGLASPVIGA